ncbi:hypothetical protein UACE39S_06534 [Ureibacillus acetophenoni]|uniref:DUF3784 domain-containing protein n=1 Tax=Ureibacillus sp. MALMAid1270 TaxID=3411629 RepID=UPI003BA4C503
MFLPAFIICLFVGLLLFLFGFLIGKKKQLTLIAGYDEKTYKGDKEKLAKAVSSFCILIGVLTILFPIGLEFIGNFIGFIYTIIVFVGTIGLVIYVNLLNKA